MGVLGIDILFGVNQSLVDALQPFCAMSAVSQVELSAQSTASTRWRATSGSYQLLRILKEDGHKIGHTEFGEWLSCPGWRSRDRGDASEPADLFYFFLLRKD
jgi:hypothetical protein